jgi:hypothetical protein
MEAQEQSLAEVQRFQQLLQANLADLNPEAIGRRLRHQVRFGRGGVTLRSRWRKFVFFWHRAERRLAVSVTQISPSAPRIRPLERFVASMRTDRKRSCPYCHKTFERTGKQKFCTKLHAARYRKDRWKRKHRQKSAA